MAYRMISRLTPTRPLDRHPRRIVLIKPCCIGDVVMATAALKALRQGYPGAHITWAVGGWSRRAIEGHDAIDALLDTGPAANPAKTPGGLLRLANQLRYGRFDLAVSLARSPLVSAAVLLSGIPHRAGLDSDGRGFGYNIRVPIDPHEIRHEAEIYLDVTRALRLDTSGCRINVSVAPEDRDNVRALLAGAGIQPPYLVVNPAGGSNPGMTMHSKRWPHFAGLIDRLRDETGYPAVMVAGPDDGAIIERVQAALSERVAAFVGRLTFGEIAALAAGSRGYIGNDTGLTHLAAATGAPTVMVFGPSDPTRYAPFTDNAIAIWQSVQLDQAGVVAGEPTAWDWERDGVDLATVTRETLAFIK